MWLTSIEFILLLGALVVVLFYADLLTSAEPDPLSERANATA